MNYTKLFDVQWDDSYNDPDFGMPGTFMDWLSVNEDKRERLAKHLEWLASALREGKEPFKPSKLSLEQVCEKMKECLLIVEKAIKQQLEYEDAQCLPLKLVQKTIALYQKPIDESVEKETT